MTEYSLFLISPVCALVRPFICLYYCRAIVGLDTWKCESSSFVHLLQDCLAIPSWTSSFFFCKQKLSRSAYGKGLEAARAEQPRVHLASRAWFLGAVPHYKEPGVFRERAHSGTGAVQARGVLKQPKPKGMGQRKIKAPCTGSRWPDLG